MSQTEMIHWNVLAGALFDDVIVPLAQARRDTAAAPYFALDGDRSTNSYFVSPTLRHTQPADFEPHSGDAASLLDALGALWVAQGDDDLVALVPHLREIADTLAAEQADGDGIVDVLCYTLF